MERTNNKIKNIISPNAITNDDIVLFLNVIHFKGTWEKQFSKEATEEREFHISKDEAKPVNMYCNYKYLIIHPKFAVHF